MSNYIAALVAAFSFGIISLPAAEVPVVNLGGPAPFQVVQGGTGWSSLQTGALLYGNGTGKVSTTTAGTAGHVLALLGGVPTWTATTTFNSPLSYSGGAVSLNTSGTWTGNAGTATALAANGSNCSAGSAAGGVNASGAAEDCIDYVQTSEFSTLFDNRLAATTSVASITTLANLSITESQISDLTHYTDADVADYINASTTIPNLLCSDGQVVKASSGDWVCAADNVGSGGAGLATSTNIAAGDVIIGTSESTVGADAGITYSAAADRLTVVNASTTALSSAYASSTNLVGGLLSVSTSLTLGGDTLSELCGTGITCTSNTLSASLGVAIDTSEITDGAILNEDINASAGIVYSKLSLANSILNTDFANADWGDISISGNTASIDANSVALTTDTTGNYVQSLADDGQSTVTVTNGVAEGGAATLRVIDVVCTGCLGATEIAGLGTADISGLDISDDTNLAASWPVVLTGDTLSWNATTSPWGANQFIYTNSAGLLVSVASSSLSLPNTALQNSTISGISLGSNLADLTATNGTLTFSGTYNGSTARTIGLNLANPNTWTAHQIFSSTLTTNATTTNATTTGSHYIGSNGSAHHSTNFFEFTVNYSTTTQGVGTTTKPATRTMQWAGTLVSQQCYFNTFMRVLVQDTAGNRMNDTVASSTSGTHTFSTNQTFTAGETLAFYVGTTTASLGTVYGNCTYRARYD